MNYSQSPEQILEKGNYMYQIGRYDAALNYYNKVIQLKPDYAEAYFGRGKVYDSQSYFDQALEDYNKAIELKPDYVDALDNRGRLYTNPLNPGYRSTIEKGIQDFNKAIEIDPTKADSYYMRGGAYFFSLADKENALDDVNKAIQYNPKLKEAYNLRANIYSVNTLKLIEEKIKENASDTNLRNWLPDSLKIELQKSKEDVNKAIEIDPSYATPYYTRGAIEICFGEYEKAVKDFDTALGLNLNPVVEKYAETFLEFAKSMIKKKE